VDALVGLGVGGGVMVTVTVCVSSTVSVICVRLRVEVRDREGDLDIDVVGDSLVESCRVGVWVPVRLRLPVRAVADCSFDGVGVRRLESVRVSS